MPNTPFDLDAAVAETKSVPPFKFVFGGETFTCQAPDDLSVRQVGKLVEMADRDPSVLLTMMLPADELERLDNLEDVFTLAALRKVQEPWLEHYGLDVPKSSGSSKPSRRTAVH